MEFDLKAHLKILTELHGPSGHEGPVRNYLREDAWKDLVDTFEVDGLGSLVGIKHGTGEAPRKRIMLSAHMDEIAMTVREIRNGYLKLSDVWGTDHRILPAMSVLVHAKERVLIGTVAAVPPHITRYTGSPDGYPSWDNLWVDLGLPTEEVARLVNIGDLVTMDAPLIELAGDRVAGKVMDDRASVAAVTACLHYLQSRVHRWDVYAVASVQEEVGLRGAISSGYYVKPDLAIALDVTFAQQPGVSGDDYPKLGKGPSINIGPNFHNGLYDGLRKAAKAIEMELFVETVPGNSGTDAWAIQISRAGVPTSLLGIPTKNMHTPVETLSLKDIDRTGRLMAEFICQLTDDYLEKIAWKFDGDEENNGNGKNNNNNGGKSASTESSDEEEND
jgi:endoglucanase